MLYFYTPWKRQKTFVFLHFQGVKKWNIGLKWVKFVRNELTNPFLFSITKTFVKLASQVINFLRIFGGYVNRFE